MPFIPHTEDDIREMLATVGVERIEDLFDEIPASLQSRPLTGLPEGLSEMAVTRLMQDRARSDREFLNFIGAGAYEHHVPAAVWQIATRGEFYSAYTPYQAEASQGTLQLVYEYQSMMCALTALDITNASLYDGASALAEAALMAVRLHKSSRRVLMPRAVHPVYRACVQSICANQGIELVELAYCPEQGRTLVESIRAETPGDIAALIIPQPNFFGVLEDVDALTDCAHALGAAAVACVNPTGLALLKPPGLWGERGADIAVGEGQPLGIPLANGGPYFGFMACKQALVRQMPGRIVGATVDVDGRRGFALTLQAREQHIRRSKATSNICTNQGLAVTAATIYLSLLGAEGLKQVAANSHANTIAMLDGLTEISAVTRRFPSPVFHEAVLCLPRRVADVLEQLRVHGILGGYDLATDYPELGHAVLVCSTETKNAHDLQRFAEALGRCLRPSV